ncbi:MAG: hypothetical protein OEN56_07045 [Gemmatimonadota bacterium]|nr:hypothetical protein [Gemmatimonadota bacterium]
MAPHRSVGIAVALIACIACRGPEPGPTLDLPTRPHDAPGGHELASALRSLDLEAREDAIHREVARGNVPGWLRRLVPVALRVEVDGTEHRVTFWTTPDYLAVGSEDDYLLIPLTPQTAQRIADLAGASLPTPSMVDAIWRAARVRLDPTPIPPSTLMTTVPVFEDHHRKVLRQRRRATRPPGTLVAGHKKDVVLTAELMTHPASVAIYGWHYLDGSHIQPLYLGHTNRWVDYSHGIRLVDDSVTVDGEPMALSDVLRNTEWSRLFSDGGPIEPARYPR